MELHIAQKGFGVQALGPARKAKANRNCITVFQSGVKEKGKKKKGQKNQGLMRSGITKLQNRRFESYFMT